MEGYVTRIDEVIDSHSHVYQYRKEELDEYFSKDTPYIAVGVGEDYETSVSVLELASQYPGKIIPCVGLHPWNMKQAGELEDILSLAVSEQVSCIGEVGLDKKFVEETYERQLEVFTRFLEFARENDVVLNLHAAGAWRDVFDLLIKYDVPKAVFHWYTGPIDLIKEIEYAGYYVSINAAILIQEKSKRTASATPMNIMLLESDGPYNYRGLRLNPSYIPRAAEIIGSLKNVDPVSVIHAANNNARLLFGINS